MLVSNLWGGVVVLVAEPELRRGVGAEAVHLAVRCAYSRGHERVSARASVDGRRPRFGA